MLKFLKWKNKGIKPIVPSKYLNPRYKKIGISLVRVLVIMNVVPHKIVVRINKIFAIIVFFVIVLKVNAFSMLIEQNINRFRIVI